MALSQDDIAFVTKNLLMLERHYAAALERMVVSLKIVAWTDEERKKDLSIEDAFQIVSNRLKREGVEMKVDAIRMRYYRMVR